MDLDMAQQLQKRSIRHSPECWSDPILNPWLDAAFKADPLQKPAETKKKPSRFWFPVVPGSKAWSIAIWVCRIAGCFDLTIIVFPQNVVGRWSLLWILLNAQYSSDHVIIGGLYQHVPFVSYLNTEEAMLLLFAD
jgi:hypothetical protein